MSVFLSCIVFGVLLWTHGQCTDTAEGRLLALKTILNQDSNLVRPDGVNGSAVSVSLEYNLVSIPRVDVSLGRFDTIGYLVIQWTDRRLSYNENHASSIKVDTSTIWIPDIELYNPAPPGIDILTRKDLATVYPDGSVLWMPFISVPSICEMAPVQDSPGAYNCTLMFASYVYIGLELELTVDSNPEIFLDLFVSEWEVVTASAYRKRISYSCCPDPFYTAFFSFVIRPKEN